MTRPASSSHPVARPPVLYGNKRGDWLLVHAADGCDLLALIRKRSGMARLGTLRACVVAAYEAMREGRHDGAPQEDRGDGERKTIPGQQALADALGISQRAVSSYVCGVSEPGLFPDSGMRAITRVAWALAEWPGKEADASAAREIIREAGGWARSGPPR